MRFVLLLCLTVLLQTFSSSAQATSQYARTAGTGRVFAYMYRTPKAFCRPHLGSNMSRVTNNVAVQIVRQKTVKCGVQSTLLMQVTVLQGIHAGESGDFLKTDLSAATDLNR